MKKGIIGKKVGMTQIFVQAGHVVPVTVIEAGPCVVAQLKTVENEGYNAVQLGFQDISNKRINKPEKGHFTAVNAAPKKYLKEFRLEDCSEYKLGDIVKADKFAAGDRVDVTGVSKGHGFSGVIKRWGCHRLKMTHGVGPVHRQPGSMGANSSPSRIFKNKKMAGQFGNVKSTSLNLEVVAVDAEKNIIAVKGAVPGAKGGIVYIRNTVK